VQAEERLKAGDLSGALDALQAAVRADAGRASLRVFLFQLLCVLGNWSRAIQQLKVSAEMDPGATPMAQTYREAIVCEVYREKVFAGQKDPLIFGEPQEWIALMLDALKLQADGHVEKATATRARAFDAAPAVVGEIDGQSFEWIADADMRLGPLLEDVEHAALIAHLLEQLLQAHGRVHVQVAPLERALVERDGAPAVRKVRTHHVAGLVEGLCGARAARGARGPALEQVDQQHVVTLTVIVGAQSAEGLRVVRIPTQSGDQILSSRIHSHTAARERRLSV